MLKKISVYTAIIICGFFQFSLNVSATGNKVSNNYEQEASLTFINGTDEEESQSSSEDQLTLNESKDIHSVLGKLPSTGEMLGKNLMTLGLLLLLLFSYLIYYVNRKNK